MLSCDRLSKRYGQRTVLDGLNLHLGPGAYALQGPNGIGKSTLLRLLAGAQPADTGKIRIAGADLDEQPIEARCRLGYAPDESPVYPFMNGRELLSFVARTKKTELSEEILVRVDQLGLEPHLCTRFEAMSLGTQKKFLLCAAWIGDPKVLLLDEPSNGLDPGARAVLAGWIRAHTAQGTILFTSHDAEFIRGAAATIIRMDRQAAHRSESVRSRRSY